jgi:hypothetical protein
MDLRAPAGESRPAAKKLASDQDGVRCAPYITKIILGEKAKREKGERD